MEAEFRYKIGFHRLFSAFLVIFRVRKPRKADPKPRKADPREHTGICGLSRAFRGIKITGNADAKPGYSGFFPCRPRESARVPEETRSHTDSSSPRKRGPIRRFSKLGLCDERTSLAAWAPAFALGHAQIVMRQSDSGRR
jgi:hypothetical protein